MNDNNGLVPVRPAAQDSLHPPNYSLQSVRDLEASEVDSFAYLRANWDVLVKHRWLILSVTVLLTVLVAVYSFRLKPVYRATARIDVEAEMPLLQTLNDLFHNEQSDDMFLATQVSVLQSDRLAWQTVQQLDLGKLPEFGGGGRPGVAGTELANQAGLVGRFKADRRIERLKDTRMLEVSFESTSPDLAAQVANALVNNYIEYNFHTKYDATRQATGWMEQQLDELKLKVEKSQQALVNYERQNSIVNIGDKEGVAQGRLDDLNRNLTATQTERLQKQSVYEMVHSNESLVSFLEQNGLGLLSRLEEKESDLREQLAEATAQYGPNHPKMIRLQEEQKNLDSLIDRERKRMVENIRNDYLAAVQREKLLADAVAQEKLEVGRVSQLLIEHNLLKRDFDSNQQLYESLLQHLKDANVSAGLRATNIHLIDAASVPTAPVRPQRARNVAFAIAVGLALGMGMAFAKEALANSIKGAQEVESLISAPALAIVPDVSSMARPGFFAKRSEAKAKKTEMVELSVLKNPGASISEAFRTLRTSIMLSTAEHPPQVLLITSSQPHEGKTSTSLNLAFTLAQMGSRILIIDADLRKRRVGKALNLGTEKGLSGILTGAYGLEEALVRVEDTEGLYALSAGPNPPNPAELLCSMKMQDLLKRTREQFDHVILDSPPVLPITDATILASRVDGVVMVVENEATTRAALSRACGVIRHSGGKILGAVLNKVDSRRDGYYGHYYYYGYYSKGYYDYTEGKGNGRG